MAESEYNEDQSKAEEQEPARELDALEFEDDVKKGYVPEGFDTVEDFLRDIRENYDADLQADDENRRAAIEDKKFAAGEQWDALVLEHRKGLPSLTINQIPQFTAQLVGDWRQSRNAIKVIPGDGGHPEIADIRGDLIRAIEYQSRAERAYDTAFESSVTCGDGAFRVSVKYACDDVFDQDLGIEPIDDSHSVVWDGLSIDPTGRDARRCFVEDTLPRKEFDRKWPGKSPSTLGDQTRKQLNVHGWVTDQNVKVVEYWRIIERDRLLCMFQDGSIHVLDHETLDDIVKTHGPPIKTRLAPCRYAQMHVVTGWDILSGPFEYKLNRLPIIRMSGRVMTVEGYRFKYGIVRFMKDPARLRNFWRSTAAEQLGYAPKAQWIATEAAVAGYEDQFRKAHLSRDPLLKVSDDAQIDVNIKRLDPPPIQAALLNEAQMNTQDMKDVTGIHDASLGIKSNEVSGKAIRARQMEGDIASITYYDNGNAALLEAGDVLNQLIGQIYDGTRIIRTIGDDEAVKLVKINDPNDPASPNLAIGKYDVALTTGASYTTRRAEAADAMMNAIQVWPELMQIAGDLVVKAQDWPGADKLAERIQKTIPQQLLDPSEQDPNQQQQGIPPQIQQMVAQVQTQLQELQQENERLKDSHDIKVEELKISAYSAETDRMKTVGSLQLQQSGMHIDVLSDLAQLDHDQQMQSMQAQTQQNSGPTPENSPSQ